MKVLAILLMISFCLIGCNEDCNCPNGNEKQIINIGALIPQTGSGSSIGGSSLAALEIAENEIDAYLESISSNYEVNFILKDSETNPAVALERVKEFHQDGISIIIGPYSSSAVAACKDYADKNDILLLSPASVSHSLAIPDDNIFRMPASDSSQAVAMAQIFKYEMDNRIIFTIMRNDVWGNDLYNLTKEAYGEIGGEMAEPVMYDPDTQDFSEILSIINNKIKEFYKTAGSKEAGVYMLSYGEGVEILENAINYSDLSRSNIIWYGSSAFANNKNLVSNPIAASFALAHTLRCPVFGLMNDAEYKWGGLQNILTEKLGSMPEVFSLLTYDAMWISALTYLHAGHDADFAILSKALVGEADLFFGATGATTFDNNGDRKLILYDIWQIDKPMDTYLWKKAGQYEGVTNHLVWF